MEYIDWSTILIRLITTIFAYLLVPTIIVLFIGKLEQKKAKTIAIINTIIVFILFRIVSSDSKFSIFPAILWGSIGYSIINGGYTITKKKVICPHCNSKNNPKRERCYMCGKKLHEEQHALSNQTRNIDKKENDINKLKENIKTLKQTYENAKKDLENNTIEKALDMYTNNLITEEQKDALINAIEGLNTIIKTYPSLITDFENKLKDLEEYE